MKIHHNPNFSRPNIRAKDEAPLSNTHSFLSKLQADNAAELDRLAGFHTSTFSAEEASFINTPPTTAETEIESPASHVHALSGSTRSAPCRNCMHSHRFGGVTGAPIPVPGGHIHYVNGQTEQGKKP